MNISETQLEGWSSLGAQQMAEATHTSLRMALDQYKWPSSIEYNVYLQGSYKNKTNIRGNSDVDLVVELTKFNSAPIFYSDLDENELAVLKVQNVDYGWRQFRKSVIDALVAYYGQQFIDTSGGKSVKVLPNGNRLKADVVVATSYRSYKAKPGVDYIEGITLWDVLKNLQIVNYPNLHYSRGAEKNSETRTNGWYKPTVRIFKNARNRIIENDLQRAKKFPSYFVECLLSNVPDNCFGSSYQLTCCKSLIWLADECKHNRWTRLVCQNGLMPLFGETSTQWNQADAAELLLAYFLLWNGS